MNGMVTLGVNINGKYGDVAYICERIHEVDREAWKDRFNDT